jgi:hypothetical protein
MAQSRRRRQSRATLRRGPDGKGNGHAFTKQHDFGHTKAMGRRIDDTRPPGGRLIPST